MSASTNGRPPVDTKGREKLRELLECAERKDLLPSAFRVRRQDLEAYLDRRELEVRSLKAALREFTHVYQ